MSTSGSSVLGCGLVLAAALLPAAAEPRTWTVAADATGDLDDVQAAIGLARDGDTVLVHPGTYELASPLRFLGKAITIRSTGGAGSTVLRRIEEGPGSLSGSVVVFDGGEGEASVLEGFTIAGGSGYRSCAACPSRGGGIYCVNASPVLRDLRIAGNRADFGGGVYCAGDAAPVLTAAAVEENSATLGGGICLADGSRALVSRSSIARNRAVTGGGIHGSGAIPVIESTRILSNEASGEGGGAYFGDGSRPLFRGSEIARNVAESGGGIAVVRADLTLEDCEVLVNTGTVAGGGILCRESDARLSLSRLHGNSVGPGDGGGLHAEFASPSLEGCVVSNNVAGRGGGVFASLGTPSLVHCTLTGNSVRGEQRGSALYLPGDRVSECRIESCIVWGNQGVPIISTLRDRRVVIHRSVIELMGWIRGEGNILGEDPLFCGFPGARSEVHVDGTSGAAAGISDGSPERPFEDVATALGSYSLALREGSPAIGAGIDGTDMGAPLGRCSMSAEEDERIDIRLGRGTHDVAGRSLARVRTLRGAGRENTVVRGTVRGLESGATISSLSITGADEGGVRLEGAEGVTLEDLTIRENSAGGVIFIGSSGTITNCVVRDNRGSGVETDGTVSVSLRRSTVVGNDQGIDARPESTLVLTSSILWGNAGGSIRGRVTASWSCIESVPAELTNIADDPLFCGWRGESEVFVDPRAPPGALGTLEDPFRDVREAADPSLYGLSLRHDSPCRGAGKDGEDMGADLGTCDDAGSSGRRIQLAPGAHEIGILSLHPTAELHGSGEGETILRGTVGRLGTALSRLTVTGTGGDMAGIVIAGGAPRIEHVTVEMSGGPGILCSGGASPELVRCTLQSNRLGGLHCASGSPKLNGCVIRCNGSYGLAVEEGDPTLTRCTITGNAGPGLLASTGGGLLNLEGCIVWGNLGPALQNAARVVASFSCLETGAVFQPTRSNINADPRFCGWRAPDVFVDALVGVAGDGSASGPHADLERALDPAGYSLALAPGSPCTGSAENGMDMGAPAGACEAEGSPSLLVHLEPGRYTLGGRVFTHRISMRGSGARDTIVEGPILGLRTGSFLEALTARAPLEGVAVDVVHGQEPRILGCRITGTPLGCSYDISGLCRSAAGIQCVAGAPTLVNCILGEHLYLAVACRSSRPVLLHCTISGAVGAWEVLESSLTVRNSVVWSDVWESSRAGVIASHSLFEEGDLLPGVGNIAADPLFAAPGDYRLRPGSPALDAASASAEAFEDIDGRPRPCGAAPDMGAHEMDCEPLPGGGPRFLRSDCDGDARANRVSDAVFLLGYSFLGTADPGCLAACDVNGDGALDITDALRSLHHDFIGEGPPPAAPYPECGAAALESDFTLGCDRPPEGCREP